MAFHIAARLTALPAPTRIDWRLAFAALLMLIALPVGAQSTGSRALAVVAGNPSAPEIVLPDVDEKPVKLSALRGKVC